jgi:hypothetical protein
MLVNNLVVLLGGGRRFRAEVLPWLLTHTALAVRVFPWSLTRGLAPSCFCDQAGSEAACSRHRDVPGVPGVQIHTSRSAPLALSLTQQLPTRAPVAETATLRHRPSLLSAPVEELQDVPGHLVPTFASFPGSPLTLPWLDEHTRLQVPRVPGRRCIPYKRGRRACLARRHADGGEALRIGSTWGTQEVGRGLPRCCMASLVQRLWPLPPRGLRHPPHPEGGTARTAMGPALMATPPLPTCHHAAGPAHAWVPCARAQARLQRVYTIRAPHACPICEPHRRLVALPVGRDRGGHASKAASRAGPSPCMPVCERAARVGQAQCGWGSPPGSLSRGGAPALVRVSGRCPGGGARDAGSHRRAYARP